MAFFTQMGTQVFLDAFQVGLKLLRKLDKPRRKNAGMPVRRTLKIIFGSGGIVGDQLLAQDRSALSWIEKGGLAGEKIQGLGLFR